MNFKNLKLISTFTLITVLGTPIVSVYSFSLNKILEGRTLVVEEPYTPSKNLELVKKVSILICSALWGIVVAKYINNLQNKIENPSPQQRNKLINKELINSAKISASIAGSYLLFFSTFGRFGTETLERAIITIPLMLNISVPILYSCFSALQKDRSLAQKEKAATLLAQQNKANLYVNFETFDQIIGHKEPKKLMSRYLQFLQSPTRFIKLGATVNQGILLVGPPGTGKTALARALAKEAGCNFIYKCGSDFHSSTWRGGDTRAMKALFEEARIAAPTIIFIDEIDTIGSHNRNTPHWGGSSETSSVLTTLLTELDGFNKNNSADTKPIILIAATNTPNSLDAAFKRRFRIINVPLPTATERKDILLGLLDKIPLGNDILEKSLDAEKLATFIALFTRDWNGSRLKDLINEISCRAIDNNREVITMGDIGGAMSMFGINTNSATPSSSTQPLQPNVLSASGVGSGASTSSSRTINIPEVD